MTPFNLIDFENAFYYFFSTIAQVLAAILGLLGVFLFFKLQSLKRTIIGFGERVQSLSSKFQDLKEEEYHHMLDQFNDGVLRQDEEKIIFQLNRINIFLEKLFNRIDFIEHDQKKRSERLNLLELFKSIKEIQIQCINLKRAIVIKIKIILHLCSLIIIASVILIPLVPILTKNEPNVLLSISVAFILFFIVSLYQITTILIISLSHDYDEKYLPGKENFLVEVLHFYKTERKNKQSAKEKRLLSVPPRP